MPETHVQSTFNSGEWAPSLYARVDLQKYRSGAALLQNWLVDYRGGASTRPGTAYVIQAADSAHRVRLIRFQAGFNVGYCLEFGQNYIRPIFNGAPVLESAFSITGATQANPCVLTVPGNNWVIGQKIFVSGVGGMTQLNGRYFSILNISGSAVTIGDLNFDNIDSTAYSAYTSGGSGAMLFIFASPYAGSDLEQLKFAQTGNIMVFAHPAYPPYQLTYITATNWSLVPIAFGTTALTPTGVFATTTLPYTDIYTTPYTFGQSHYSYKVTSVDAVGQESAASAAANIGPVLDIRTYPGTNAVQWAPAAGAKFYKVYEANISYFGVQPPGVQYGYVGYSTSNTFIDDNIVPDFSQSIPVPQNPFVGAGLAFITVTALGTYTTVPGVTLTGGSPTTTGTAAASLTLNVLPTINAAGTGFAVGDTINFGNGVVLIVTGIGSGGAITSWAEGATGSIVSGSTPANPVAQVVTSGAGINAKATLTWGVGAVNITSPGNGYATAPTVVFSSGAATAVATLSPTGNGNPAVPSFFQQRLVLAGAPGSPQTFNMSQPGAYSNFDIHQPILPDDAIQGTLVTNTANTIKSIVSVPAGMLVFTDQAAWVVNGGGVFQGLSAAVTPANVVATAQSFIGASDVPPIIANYDILFVQSKGSQVRDLAYNIYFNVFTGTDVSLISSHLFYGYTVTEWAWAEQPFFVVWAVRNDGTMLTLTFLKEQEFVGWSHQITVNGLFKSVCSVTESTNTAGVVDAVYAVVERIVNGVTVKYIERVAERAFPAGLSSAWCVDSGQQYIGPATLSFQGAEHLAGQVVTGLAEDDLGNVYTVTPFTMPVTGFFTLPAPTAPGSTGYVLATIGLGYNCDLQTLPLDVGEPTIQGKTKKIASVAMRVADTLGLSIGSDFNNLVPMKDLVLGNVSRMLVGQQSGQIVTGLVDGYASTILDPTYTVPGQYCIRQALPYPASVLGVGPEFVVDRRQDQ